MKSNCKRFHSVFQDLLSSHSPFSQNVKENKLNYELFIADYAGTINHWQLLSLSRSTPLSTNKRFHLPVRSVTLINNSFFVFICDHVLFVLFQELWKNFLRLTLYLSNFPFIQRIMVLISVPTTKKPYRIRNYLLLYRITTLLQIVRYPTVVRSQTIKKDGSLYFRAKRKGVPVLWYSLFLME